LSAQISIDQLDQKLVAEILGPFLLLPSVSHPLLKIWLREFAFNSALKNGVVSLRPFRNSNVCLDIAMVQALIRAKRQSCQNLQARALRILKTKLAQKSFTQP
jgi:hypothetical protein